MESGETSALVLSAGGMFGAWQAGVWQAISRIFDPDIVVGASVGALNGWLVACGRAGDELTARWLAAGDLAAIRWKMPASLTDGVLDGTALERWIQESCAFGPPRRRFGVVLTHTRKLRLKLFEWPDAGWQHIAASCGVPLFLRQHRIGGSYYCDGGIIDPLPLRAALDMGATRVVTINLMKHRPRPVEHCIGALRAVTRYTAPDCAAVRIVDISPEGRLGSARDSMYWSEINTRRWIEEGRQAGLARRDAIMRLIGKDSVDLSNSPAA